MTDKEQAELVRFMGSIPYVTDDSVLILSRAGAESLGYVVLEPVPLPAPKDAK